MSTFWTFCSIILLIHKGSIGLEKVSQSWICNMCDHDILKINEVWEHLFCTLIKIVMYLRILKHFQKLFSKSFLAPIISIRNQYTDTSYDGSRQRTLYNEKSNWKRKTKNKNFSILFYIIQRPLSPSVSYTSKASFYAMSGHTSILDKGLDISY